MKKPSGLIKSNANIKNKNGSDLVFIIILGMFSALSPLSIDLYLPALPIITADLGATQQSIKMTLTLFILGFSFGQLFWGPLSDSLGRKKTLLISCFLFSLATLICIISKTEHALVYSRLFQGFFGSATGAVVIALVRDRFDQNHFARVVSLVILVMTVAPLVAPIVGGFINLWFGWRYIFVFIFMYVVLGMILFSFLVKETLPAEKRTKLNVKTICSNYRKVLFNRRSIGYFLCSGFSFAGLFSFITSSSFVYQNYFHVKPENFGFYFALNVAALIVMTIFNARLVLRLGAEKLLRIGLFVQLCGAVIMMIGLLTDGGLVVLTIGMMTYAGMLSVIGSNVSAVVLYLFSANSGLVSALLTFFRFGMAAMISSGLAYFSSNTPQPMVISIFVCGILSGLSYLFARKVNKSCMKKYNGE